jgi:hypothetical protein
MAKKKIKGKNKKNLLEWKKRNLSDQNLIYYDLFFFSINLESKEIIRKEEKKK